MYVIDFIDIVWLVPAVATTLDNLLLGPLLLLWSPYAIGQTIIFLPYDFYLLSFFFFFPRLISAPPQIGCMPYLHTWCGLSANLRCRSETCCTRLAETQDAKNQQKSPSAWAPSHNFVGLCLHN